MSAAHESLLSSKRERLQSRLIYIFALRQKFRRPFEHLIVEDNLVALSAEDCPLGGVYSSMKQGSAGEEHQIRVRGKGERRNVSHKSGATRGGGANVGLRPLPRPLRANENFHFDQIATREGPSEGGALVGDSAMTRSPRLRHRRRPEGVRSRTRCSCNSYAPSNSISAYYSTST
ncbi:hypothetical protein EVAR_22043_1 [Eumeta japonica]|uniref:Uncharacterized protein n=1 Tax=Eumeta variegata TaxID=151549 RepID=A0A4C1USI7_EUMVA|nr:hypothetical protein EVAR_22043_1 [Eumeta japonica]